MSKNKPRITIGCYGQTTARQTVSKAGVCPQEAERGRQRVRQFLLRLQPSHLGKSLTWALTLCAEQFSGGRGQFKKAAKKSQRNSTETLMR